jgi:hypothetical protein
MSLLCRATRPQRRAIAKQETAGQAAVSSSHRIVTHPTHPTYPTHPGRYLPPVLGPLCPMLHTYSVSQHTSVEFGRMQCVSCTCLPWLSLAPLLAPLGTVRHGRNRVKESWEGSGNPHCSEYSSSHSIVTPPTPLHPPTHPTHTLAGSCLPVLGPLCPRLHLPAGSSCPVWGLLM